VDRAEAALDEPIAELQVVIQGGFDDIVKPHRRRLVSSRRRRLAAEHAHFGPAISELKARIAGVGLIGHADLKTAKPRREIAVTGPYSLLAHMRGTQPLSMARPTRLNGDYCSADASPRTSSRPSERVG
jgi:hypothetical protein